MSRLAQKLAIAILFLQILSASASAQISSADITFLRLSTQTNMQAFRDRGGDTAPIQAIVNEANRQQANPVAFYRGYSQALTLLKDVAWTPNAELATALDFRVSNKIVEPGDMLQASASFIFDAPAAASGPYRLELTILKTDESQEAAVPQTIELGDVKPRKAGEFVGVAFVPSKLVSSGVHLIRATLKDGSGAPLQDYYRSFFVIDNFKRRLNALEKAAQGLPDQQSPVAMQANYVVKAAHDAKEMYLGGAYQDLVGFLHTVYRLRGYAKNEVMNFDAEMDRATQLVSTAAAGSFSLDGLRGDQKLAYRSTFDNKLVPYRIYVPTNYDKSKKYPLVVLLHGAGGDENSFFEGYQKLWPKLAEERGYIIIGANGRGPLGGYSKESGGEQDMLDLFELGAKNYNIDPQRVFLGGHSMGGQGTWRLGFLYRDKFAAIAPMAGTRAAPAENVLTGGYKVPLVIVAGGKDALMPVAAAHSAHETVKGRGYDVKYVEYAEGDHSSCVTMAVKDVYDFFDAHRKPTP